MRAGLPDHEPFRAWACFEVVAEDASVHEVDLLVLAPAGFFLIEIKSWEGTVSGDVGTWRIDGGGGRGRTVDSPLLLANRKARKLVSLLRQQKATRSLRLPYLAPLVFLSHPDVRCELAGSARQGVWLRDRPAVGAAPARPGIRSVLRGEGRGETGRSDGPRIDRPMAKAIARAVEEAGIRPTERGRKVGDFGLDELLFQGPHYQDWLGHHLNVEQIKQWIRLYPYASANAAGRAELEREAQRELTALEGLDHPGLLAPLHYSSSELGPPTKW